MSEIERTRERALDVALAEATGRSTAPDVAAVVRERLREPGGFGAGPAEAGSNSWSVRLTLAAVLFGVCATVVVAFVAQDERRDRGAPADAAGEPIQSGPIQSGPGRALPADPIRVLGVDDLSRAPLDARAIRLRVDRPELGWLDGIGRLKDLEHLEIMSRSFSPVPPARGRARDPELPDEGFAALSQCPKLRFVSLRRLHGWSADHVRTLRGVEGLTSLDLATFGTTLDEELGRALAELPALRDLSLGTMAVTTTGLRVLAERIPLRSLSLREPAGIDAEGLAVIASIESLRSLALSRIDSTQNRASSRFGMPMSMDLLGPDFLTRLPQLDSLDLSSNRITAARIEAFPRSVRSLVLRDIEGVDGGVGEALLDLPELSELDLGGSSRLAPVIERALLTVLRGKLMTRLGLTAWPAAELEVALRRQQLLRTLSVQQHVRDGEPADGAIDLDFVAHLPLLQDLTIELSGTEANRARFLRGLELEPLAAPPRLRRVQLYGFDPVTTKRIRSVVGESVQVTG